MALPVDYGTVPVRGRYVYLDGTPATGQIRFTGKVVSTSGATDTIILPATIAANLDANGEFLVNLPATDDPDIQPNGWTYEVSEQLTKGAGRTFNLDVPLSAAAAGIDLSEVAPIDSSSGDPTAFVTLTTYQSGRDAQSLMLLRLMGYMDNAIEAGLRWLDGTYTLGSGRVELSYVRAYRTLTVTQLGAVTRSTAGTGITGHRKGIYVVNADGSLTLVARTALLTSGYTTQWAEQNAPLDTSGGFPAAYTMQAGQLYVLAHFITFTGTAPAMRAYSTNAPSALNLRAPLVAATVNGQADLATSYPAPTVGSGNALYQYAL